MFSFMNYNKSATTSYRLYCNMHLMLTLMTGSGSCQGHSQCNGQCKRPLCRTSKAKAHRQRVALAARYVESGIRNIIKVILDKYRINSVLKSFIGLVSESGALNYANVQTCWIQ
jgi:hypothetical protein